MYVALSGLGHVCVSSCRFEAVGVWNFCWYMHICNVQDPAQYVEKACRLIRETGGAVWRLFLPAVWRAVLAEGNYHLVDKIVTCLKGCSSVQHSGQCGEW